MQNLIESFSEILTPYRAIIGPVASVVTIGQFFAGFIICKDISTKGTTRGFSSMPFVGGLVVGIIMLKYALMLQDVSMFIVNLSAIVLNAIYIVIYNNYSENKKEEIHQPLIWGSILTIIVFMYSFWEAEDQIEYRFGLIVTVLLLILMGSPLIEVKEIIRKKDASSIPLPITLTACIVCALWFLYGFILRNEFMIVQNLLGFLLCFAQVVLYYLYRSPDTKVKEKKT